MHDTDPSRPPEPPDSVSRSARPVRGGCWRTGLLTCGVLTCVLGVLFVVLLIAAGPYLGRARALNQQSAECRSHLEGGAGLQGALQRYRFQKKEYPARLLDLFPRYVSKRATFHCPADPSFPGTVSYTYRRPAPDAPVETSVLICDHHAFWRLVVPIEGEARRQRPAVLQRGGP